MAGYAMPRHDRNHRHQHHHRHYNYYYLLPFHKSTTIIGFNSFEMK